MTLLLALAVLAQAAGTIRGVVLDTTNGVPVGRVSVRLQATGLYDTLVPLLPSAGILLEF